MRRRASRGADSTPMLMSATSEPDVSDVVGTNTHLVLTPRVDSQRRMCDPSVSYEEIGTPTAKRAPPPHRVLSTSRGMSEYLGREDSIMIMATNVPREDSIGALRPPPTLSQRAAKAWYYIVSMVLPVFLLAAIFVRVNIVSAIYLVLYCVGVLQSFRSSVTTILIVIFSAFVCIGHIVFAALFQGRKGSWEGESTLKIIGFSHIGDAADVVTQIVVDVLVLVSSVLHYFYVLRRLRMNLREDDRFDFFAAGANMLDAQMNRKQSTVRWVEVLSGILLLVTATAVPAIASGVNFLMLLVCLVRWTFWVKYISVESFVLRDVKSEFFFGSAMSKVVLTWSFLVVLTWYIFQLDGVVTNDTIKDVMKYAGFADFRHGAVRGEFYVFAACQLLLFVCSAKMFKLHRSVEKDTDTLRLSAGVDDTTDTFRRQASRELSQGLLRQKSGADTTPSQLRMLLSQQPFHQRIFLGDGGSLLASAAAIVWCVSYPSYTSAVMMGWALITLGLYGIVRSLPLVFVLIGMGTLLSMTEYVVNMTIDVIDGDYTIYGLREFEHPFLDLGIHNVCLVIIYASIRTRWRYQKVLRASVVIEDTQSGSPDLEERSSMESFRVLAGLRRNLQTNWKNALPLWLNDTKQVIFTHMDALVLLTILGVALSTRVSFIQTGYLVLAVIVMLFFEHRRKLWRVLLAYALLACLAVFIRNVDCSSDSTLDLVGLPCYDSASYTWTSLWPTLFSAQLVIIFQLVFQLVVYKSNAETIKERIRTMKFSHQNPIFFVSRIAVELDNIFRVIGSVVCYIAILLVAFHSETNENDRHTTVIGAIQLLVLFIVLGGHLGGFKRAPRTSLRLKLLWLFALLVQSSVLILRYVFQFDQVSDYMEEHIFTSDFISSKDFGLENRSSETALSSIFFYLLPSAALMALSLWQLASVLKDVRPYDIFAPGRSRLIDQVLFWIETIRQVLMAFSTTCLVLVTMGAAVSRSDVVGLAYVIILVLGRPFVAWKKLWFPLFWVSAIAVLSGYLYQLRAFGNDEDSKKYLHYDLGKDGPWFGLKRLYSTDGDTEVVVSMWKIEDGPLLVIMMCFFQRLAQYFEQSDIAKRATARPDGPIETLNETSGAAFGNTYFVQAGASDVPRGLSLGAQNAQDDDDDESDFFSSMRAFCIEYASHASVNVVMLMLMASSFFHRDAISVLYMLMVYGMMYADASTVCKRWFLIVLVLSLVILVEYALMVWLPPFFGVEQQRTHPWEILSESNQAWLALKIQHKWALLADFIGLLAAYMLPQSHQLRGKSKQIQITVQDSSSGNIRGTGVSRVGVSFAASTLKGVRSQDEVMVESHYIQLTRKYMWYYIEYLMILWWLPVTLVLVFICGAANGGVISLVYIGSAIVMLYRLDQSRSPRNQWIHYLRKWNWVHLFMMVIIHAPIIRMELISCRVGKIDETTGETCMTVANVLGVEADSIPAGIIAIFVMISIHCEMLVSPTYQEVCRYFENERQLAMARRQEIIRAFYRDRTARWFEVKKEKSLALQRLKMIVSKLVHKVEELMDIAMGVHYNLPPMAPPKPQIVEVTQNSVTLSWEAPKDSLHKIRHYRITRQQYPSMTLLGDFADLVEVKGSMTYTTIEGLRPGTSYQFKVAAVSRMGEGPFSVPSDPASTFSLNLNGSCTAGWMKYRRENVTTSKFTSWLSWFQPKYLHRYVVMDNRQLVFYRDEEIALRHRSRKRRKRIKTAFSWKNVVSLRLSETKVQFDDMSPLLYCFELIVHQDGDDSDKKYIFQADLTKDFDRFLSALAFAVPIYTIEDSIIELMKIKNLPTPHDTINDSPESNVNEGADDGASEVSSVTGDESSFGDPEDAEFDEEKKGFSWRIPLYRFFYQFQDAALQAETTVYDPEDQVEPCLTEILTVCSNSIRSHSAAVCYVVLTFAFAFQADLLNLVYVIVTFGYLALESPRPSSLAWVLLLKYTCAIIALRYAFQLPLFCQGLSGTGYYYPSIQPWCGASSNSVVLREKSLQPVVIMGLYKFDGSVLKSMDTIFGGLQWDFFVAVAILWHRQELIIRGLWDEPYEEKVPEEDDVVSKRFRNSLLSSRDSIDDTFNFGVGRATSRDVRSLDKPDPPPLSTKPSAVEEDAALAEELLQELEAKEREENASAEAKPRTDTMVEPPPSTVNPVTSAALAVTSQQIEIEDAETVVVDRKKAPWLERKLPRVSAFFDRVICHPPPQWDKDIHAAISGAKPGRDYYTISLTMLLLVTIFAILFFKQLGEPQANTEDMEEGGAPIASSSMVSGYLVLIVFIELCFIIWDRAAYVCGSLGSKIALQFTYVFVLHVFLWLLLPQYTESYFQKRPALVIFYLLHCLYLWCGSLQIRYGYPVFEGSRYNYTTANAYTKMREKISPLVMLVPFIFEMRALLDYICTKTSLSMAHWLMLEETAAHLFQLKLEMRGRVEDAEVLQGKRRQPMPRKLMSAGIMLFLLLLCLIGPLALFSSANPSTKANRVTTADVVLGLEDSRGTVNRLYSGTDINSPDYEGDQIADGAAIQRVTFDTFSRETWASSPPNIERLVTQLKSNESLWWILMMSFNRPGPTDHQAVDTTFRVPVSETHRANLTSMIQLASNNKTEKEATAIRIDSILPPVVQLTATDGVFRRSRVLRSVNITKHSVQGSSWWAVTPILRNETEVIRDNDKEYCDTATPFCVIAVSDNIVQGLTTLGIGSYGISAVYFFVLVTIGSAVKGFFRGALFQIQYSELPDPDDVLELVEGIYIARGERYVGHLKDEVRIFETLVRVLRSPETLTKVTGNNVIHIPATKQKQD
ncbi:hypothetical protein Poli38472_000268 [Pythium oligandrum]|uniref:Fibronectin type-III domain-containing protein n=1 Tax=Pythium oligandrum TaxID=41045 RepID=A0A8K1FF66_PYTOL|nr:hypothetical protein Poli38472_000268 [Pythium oligandrum]|eukprot:TMW60226.1 hypothetical protein Poli38472_000268 [Pythium oligandrum]